MMNCYHLKRSLKPSPYPASVSKWRRVFTSTGFTAAVLAAIVALALPGSIAAARQDKEITITVIGSGRVISDNLPAARQQAVADGLEEAVNQALARLLPPQTIVDKFQLIGQLLLPKTESFILGYKVLAEATHDKHYRVAVQATVSLERIKTRLADIGLMLGSMPYPRVLVLISERQVEDIAFRPWWSGSPDNTVVSGKILARQLADKGFIIIKPDTKRLPAQFPARFSADQAEDLARDLNADVVVFGTAVAQESANTMGESIRSFNATVRLNALKVAGKINLASTEQTAAAVYTDAQEGGRRALQAAAGQAADDLASKIESYWKKQAQASAPIKVLVTGTGGQIANFVRFRGVLGTVSGVDAVRLSQIMPDQAELEVDYQGDAPSLAQALLARQFGNFGINIYQIGTNEIRLNLVAR